MWNGRDPKKEITFEGATFGSIEHWADGIITRGVMLDVPRHRGVPCVTQDRPVHGWELDDILTARGIRLQPGGTVCVYSGRDAWQAQDPERPYGRPFGPGIQQRPGLHVSCLPFLRDHDVSVVWDMLDHLPIGYDIPWAVHAALFAYLNPPVKGIDGSIDLVRADDPVCALLEDRDVDLEESGVPGLSLGHVLRASQGRQFRDGLAAEGPLEGSVVGKGPPDQLRSP